MKYISLSNETYNDIKNILNRSIVGKITFDKDSYVFVKLYQYRYSTNGAEDVTTTLDFKVHDVKTVHNYNFPLPDDFFSRKDVVTYVNRLLYLIKRGQLELVN